MNDRRIKKLSHRMSWMLRHGAGELRLPMDAAGWVLVNDLLHHLHADSSELDEVVRHNNKARYELDGDYIRATQGHSLEGMPVTRKALERSWDVYAGDDTVWHGTNVNALVGISSEGIVPGRRSHVHLAAELDSTVGKRANVAVMLEISAKALRSRGYELFVSKNGVVLTRLVPPSCIRGLRAMTRTARKQEATLRRLLPAAHSVS
jgi:putative RNA 2'-phosphotransferase